MSQMKKEAQKELDQINKQFTQLKEDYDVLQKREELLDDRFYHLSDKHNDIEFTYQMAIEEKMNRISI